MKKIQVLIGVMSLLVFVLRPGSIIRASTPETGSGSVGIEERLGAQIALDAGLKDEQGNDTTLRQLIHKPTILTLNYFHCPGICTPILNGIVDVVNKIHLEPGRDFQIITVSFDPADTPAVARKERIDYFKQMKRPFPPNSWNFLTGTVEATRQVTDSVGFKFRSEGSMFSHPGTIMVLTPAGIVSRYIHGTGYLTADIEMALRESAAGQVRPTITNLLAYCYPSEPESRQLFSKFTRAIGGGFLLLIGGFVVYVLRGKSKASKPETRLSK
jgi:protein SCO1/2